MFEFIVIEYMPLYRAFAGEYYEPKFYTLDTFEIAMDCFDDSIGTGRCAELWMWDGAQWFRIAFAGNDKHHTTPLYIG